MFSWFCRGWSFWSAMGRRYHVPCRRPTHNAAAPTSVGAASCSVVTGRSLHFLLREALGQHARVFVLVVDEVALEVAGTGAGGDEVTDDHVLLQAVEVVLLRVHGGFVQHLGGLLEGGGADPAVRLQRGAGDAHEQLAAGR